LPRESRPLATAFFLRQIKHNLALLVGTCWAHRFAMHLGKGMSGTLRPVGLLRVVGCLASLLATLGH